MFYYTLHYCSISPSILFFLLATSTICGLEDGCTTTAFCIGPGRLVTLTFLAILICTASTCAACCSCISFALCGPRESTLRGAGLPVGVVLASGCVLPAVVQLAFGHTNVSSPMLLNVLPLTGVGGSDGSLQAGDVGSDRLGADSDITGAVTERTNFICRATCTRLSSRIDVICVFGDAFGDLLGDISNARFAGDVTLRCRDPLSTT